MFSKCTQTFSKELSCEMYILSYGSSILQISSTALSSKYHKPNLYYTKSQVNCTIVVPTTTTLQSLFVLLEIRQTTTKHIPNWHKKDEFSLSVTLIKVCIMCMRLSPSHWVIILNICKYNIRGYGIALRLAIILILVQRKSPPAQTSCSVQSERIFAHFMIAYCRRPTIVRKAIHHFLSRLLGKMKLKF